MHCEARVCHPFLRGWSQKLDWDDPPHWRRRHPRHLNKMAAHSLASCALRLSVHCMPHCSRVQFCVRRRGDVLPRERGVQYHMYMTSKGLDLESPARVPPPFSMAGIEGCNSNTRVYPKGMAIFDAQCREFWARWTRGPTVDKSPECGMRNAESGMRKRCVSGATLPMGPSRFQIRM